MLSYITFYLGKMAPHQDITKNQELVCVYPQNVKTADED